VAAPICCCAWIGAVAVTNDGSGTLTAEYEVFEAFTVLIAFVNTDGDDRIAFADAVAESLAAVEEVLRTNDITAPDRRVDDAVEEIPVYPAAQVSASVLAPVAMQ